MERNIRRRIAIALTVLAVTACSNPASESPEKPPEIAPEKSPEPDGSIEVLVLHRGEPLSGAHVGLHKEGESSAISTEASDAAGAATFDTRELSENELGGSYEVVVVKDGYWEARSTGTFSEPVEFANESVTVAVTRHMEFTQPASHLVITGEDFNLSWQEIYSGSTYRLEWYNGISGEQWTQELGAVTTVATSGGDPGTLVAENGELYGYRVIGMEMIDGKVTETSRTFTWSLSIDRR